MSVRALIALPPAFRASGTSDALVPPLAKPHTAQSRLPAAVRSTLAAGGELEPVNEPDPVPPPGGAPAIGVHAESSEVPSGPVAVAVTT